MMLFRKESFGGILFDTKTMGFSLTGPDDRPDYDRRVKTGPDHGRRDIISAPVAVYYELTGRCNLECRHCFTNSGGARGEGLPGDAVFSVLERLAEAGVMNLRFTGGEPTTRADWFDILKRSRNLGFAVSLQTNGVFSDPAATAEKLAALELDQITVSVDGVGPAHDALRGAGSFARVEKSLNAMAAAGIRPRINTILTKLNCDRLGEIFEFVSRYSDSINIFYMRVIGRGIKNTDIMIDFSLHHATSERVLKISKNYPGLRVFHSASGSPRPLKIPAGADIPEIVFPCGSTALSIAAGGTVWPHHYSIYQSASLALGRFPEDSVSSIWAGSKKLDAMRGWLKKLRERCLRCTEHETRCSGIDFEMELEAAYGRIEKNPCCVCPEKAPEPDFI